MSIRPLRIAVIGGGIGGLAAAHALLRQGIEVTVHEQASKLGEIGAGVQLAPNGFRLLARYGLGDAIGNAAVRFEPGSQYRRKDGSGVAPSVIADSSGKDGVFGMHRADLLGILADGLPSGVIQTGQRGVTFEQDERSGTVGFENGDSVEADVILGADGIHSVLRAHVVKPSTPVHSGMVAYRGLIPAAQLPDWSRTTWQMWMGDGKHFLVFPVRRGTLLNYVGFVPSGEETQESWSAPGDPDRLRGEFAGWDPQVVELLSKVDSTFWWGLYDREPISRWTEGRLTLLGDAAHPMLPHLGQGANQSIEDGAALAVLLGKAGPDDTATALTVYETLRKERAASVQTGSRANGRRYDSTADGAARRDAEIAASEKQRWSIYDYDAEAAAAQELVGS